MNRLERLGQLGVIPMMVYAVAGSWLATSKMISLGAFDEITRLASEAVNIARCVRESGAKT